MENITLIDNFYYTRFHNMKAWYRWNGSEWFFISYKKHMLSIEPRNTYGYKDYVIYAYEYRGTTTQKHCTRFIEEFCGNNYHKAYKIARYYMRQYKGESMLLVPTDTKTKFSLTIYANGRVKKDMYIFI